MKNLKCIECGNSEGVEMWKNKIPLCKKHYLQISRHGKIFKRTRFDPNEIHIYEDYAEVCLYNKECEEIARTKISLNFIEKVKTHKWSIDRNGYVVSTGDNKLLHREIIEVNPGELVDHINGDTLDNRFENLRVCNKSENAINSKKSKANTSGVKGVAFDKNKGKWVAHIRAYGKNINLGRHNTKEEAIEARKQAEIQYHGEYARKEAM